MGSQPIEGRCNAHKRPGDYCHSYPIKGRTRCFRHGGATPKKVHGLYGRFKTLTGEGMGALTDYLEHPDLLDEKRAAALHMFILEALPLEPTEQSIEVRAQGLAGIGATVTDGHREVARLQLAADITRILRQHQIIVTEAQKSQDRRDILMAGTLPLLQDFARAVAVVIRRYVPTEDRQNALDEIKALVYQSVARIQQLGAGIE